MKKNEAKNEAKSENKSTSVVAIRGRVELWNRGERIRAATARGNERFTLAILSGRAYEVTVKEVKAGYIPVDDAKPDGYVDVELDDDAIAQLNAGEFVVGETTVTAYAVATKHVEERENGDVVKYRVAPGKLGKLTLHNEGGDADEDVLALIGATGGHGATKLERYRGGEERAASRGTGFRNRMRA